MLGRRRKRRKIIHRKKGHKDETSGKLAQDIAQWLILVLAALNYRILLREPELNVETPEVGVGKTRANVSTVHLTVCTN